MSGAPSAGPNQQFRDRVDNAAETRAHKPPVSVLPDWKAAFIGPIGIGLAILMGMLAVIAVRAGLYHYAGYAMIGDSPNTIMAFEAGAALLVSLTVFLFFPYKGAQYNFLQFLGVVVMISMMHNLVHKAPGVFALAFSPEWAETVTTVTEPNSFFVRGQSVPFIKEPVQEKVLPPVRRG